VAGRWGPLAAFDVAAFAAVAAAFESHPLAAAVAAVAASVAVAVAVAVAFAGASVELQQQLVVLLVPPSGPVEVGPPWMWLLRPAAAQLLLLALIPSPSSIDGGLQKGCSCAKVCALLPHGFCCKCREYASVSWPRLRRSFGRHHRNARRVAFTPRFLVEAFTPPSTGRHLAPSAR
jgi:hypothetical protein